MLLYGDDFAYMNAYSNFENLRRAVKAGNEMGKDFNMTFVISTPRAYVDAMKSENASFPVKYDEFLNYYQEEQDKNNRTQYNFWSGFYTSRPGIKSHVKTASA